MTTIYAFGYTGRKLDTIAQGAAATGALILDIRYSPRSRAPMWNRRNLEAVLGASYFFAGDLLGNLDYRSDGIRIADLDAGLDLLEKVAAKHPVGLMCACKERAGCHRDVICLALEARGYDILNDPPAAFSAPALPLSPGAP